MGWAGASAAKRRRLCRMVLGSLSCGRPPTAKLVLQSTSKDARMHLRRRSSTVGQHEAISRRL